MNGQKNFTSRWLRRFNIVKKDNRCDFFWYGWQSLALFLGVGAPGQLVLERPGDAGYGILEYLTVYLVRSSLADDVYGD